MPEATIHKYRNLLFAKDEIWFAEDGLMASPTSDMSLAEKFCEDKFCCPIALTADSGHNR